MEDREEGREVGGEAHVDIIDAIGLGQLGLLLDLLLEVLLAVERLELSFLRVAIHTTDLDTTYGCTEFI